MLIRQIDDRQVLRHSHDRRKCASLRHFGEAQSSWPGKKNWTFGLVTALSHPTDHFSIEIRMVLVRLYLIGYVTSLNGAFFTLSRDVQRSKTCRMSSRISSTKVVVMKLILFGFEIRPKKPVYGPPKPAYGIPNSPKPSYGIPIAPPSNTYGVAPPSNTYGVAPPSNTYGVAPPSNTYGPGKPSSVYGIEPPPIIDLTYGPPQQRLSASASQIHSQYVNAPNDDNLVCMRLKGNHPAICI